MEDWVTIRSVKRVIYLRRKQLVIIEKIPKKQKEKLQDERTI